MISVRDLATKDVPNILNYWFHSPPAFIEAMGVDPSKLPKEDEMEKSLIEKCKSNESLPASKLNAVVIMHDDEPIGFHTLFPYTEGDFGIFHAHIWDSKMRGREVALQSYILAAQIFMKRFKLKKIIYKTPIQNTGAIRVKEKLGIRCVGEETIGFGIIKYNTRAKVFEITSTELKEFIKQQLDLAGRRAF